MAFFGGGASVDLASPSAIGSTTPNTGAFTTLSANNGTITSSSPLFSASQTWNNAASAFTGISLSVTNSASGASSRLIDFSVGGSSVLDVDNQGTIRLNNSSGTIRFSGAGSRGLSWGNNSHLFCESDETYYFGRSLGGSRRFGVLGDGVVLYDIATFAWTNSNQANGTRDLFLRRDAAGVLAQYNSTNAQTFRLYRTFTDASNYERLSLIATRTTRFAIAAEKAGTGAARSLEISFYTSASDPTSTDITDGCFSVWKNSGTGTIKMWANDGGTMKSVALA